MASTAARLARMYDLWDWLADFPPGQLDAARVHTLQELSALVDADNAMWAGVVRLNQPLLDDPLNGWRMPVMTYLHALPGIDTTIRDYQQRYDDAPDQKSIRYHGEGGTFRVRLLAELVDPEWFESEVYERFFRVGMNAVDVMFVGCPVNADAEGAFAFFRAEKRFTAEDCAIAHEALRGLRWFQRQLMLGYGLLVADAPLTPVEQRVVQEVLRGKSAKEIAAELEHSPHTTNEHLNRIYRKFGVKSGRELMAIWLGQPLAPP